MQARYAGLITAIAVQRGLPARAASIALATAYQESDLRNLTAVTGTRSGCSSSGRRWAGARRSRSATRTTRPTFYDALAKVDGYEQLEITEAAQRVQRSGFPDAYADHEADARALASALTGNSPEGVQLPAGRRATTADRARGVGADRPRGRRTPRPGRAFPDQPLGGFAPGGVSTGHMEGSAHYDGRAIDVFVRPVSPANKTRGWAFAQYLVSQADRLAIKTVIFDDRIWTAGRRPTTAGATTTRPSGPATRVILEHRDHVHVDVVLGHALSIRASSFRLDCISTGPRLVRSDDFPHRFGHTVCEAGSGESNGDRR